MSKDTRSGGKYSGSHTTTIPAAAIICDEAHACPYVVRISLGFIKPGLPPVGRRVKIIKKDAVLQLSVRDSTSHQEVWVYCTNYQKALETIARGVRNNHMHLSFR